MPGQRYCRTCATDANRRWRDEHRDEINARRRGRTKSEEERLYDRARAHLYMALRRRKLFKAACCEAEGCFSEDVRAFFRDYADPLRTVEWYCADDLRERRARHRRALEQQQKADVFAMEFAALPPVVQDSLRAFAAKGPFGTTLSAEAPLYRQKLIQAFHAYRDGRIVQPGALLRDG